MRNNDNDNVNVSVKNTITMNNDIDRGRQVEVIADKLVEKYGSNESFAFYCKVAYCLPENTIWNNYEKSQTGKNPAGLFNWLCRRDMGK